MFTEQKTTHCSKKSQEVLHLSGKSTTTFSLYFLRIIPKNVFTLRNRNSHELKKNTVKHSPTNRLDYRFIRLSINADQYAADVYDAGQLNAKQETKTVNIISVLPAKVAVDNTANKQAAQTFGAILGAVVGGVAGHNVGSGSGLGTTAGAVGGGAVGAAAGTLVKDKSIVEGVSLTYKEGTKVFTSTQVGKPCQFTTGLAVVISTKNNETRIQPNTTCPVKK